MVAAMTGTAILVGMLVLQAANPVRSHNKRILAALDDARRRSPTFEALLSRVEASDVIVYIESGRCGSPQVWSCVAIASGRPYRYLRVTLDTDHSRQLIIAQLAHELQHAVEIAEAPDVVDGATLRALYGRIGTRSSADAFETTAAIRVAARIAAELGW
jgi:hypothetical protein